MPRLRAIHYLALIGLAGLVLLVYFQMISFTAVDLGRHLANGRALWNHPELLSHNFYSYTEPDFPFINHHWLYGLLVYGIYLFSGFAGLSAFNAVVGLAAFLMFFFLARRRAGFWSTAILSLPVILLLSERVEVRPEMVSYLFIALSLYLLERVRRTRDYRWLWAFSPFLLIWTNVHIYFFIGLALLAFAGLADLRNWKARFWPYLAALAVCFINPNFWRGLLYPLNIFQNYGYEVAENKSVFFLDDLMLDGNFLVFKILLIIFILSWVAYVWKERRVRIFDLLCSLFFSAFALAYSRNISLFGLAALPVIAANLSPWLKVESVKIGGRKPIFWASTFFILFLAAFFLLIHDGQEGRLRFLRQPWGAGVAADYDASFRFFQDNNLSGPIFNNYDLGSALIFWLGEQEKVFVDNRPEAYSASFFSETYKPMQLKGEKWEEAVLHYGLKTVYFSHTDGTPWGQVFLSRILQDESWYLLYFDAQTVIVSSDPSYSGQALDAEGFIARYTALSSLSSRRERLSLANLAISAGYLDLAGQALRQMVEEYPRDYRPALYLANLYSSSGDPRLVQEAITLYDRVIAAGAKLPSVYDNLGLAHWTLGEYLSAHQAWQQALRRNRKDAAAASYLQQLDDLVRQGTLPAFIR